MKHILAQAALAMVLLAGVTAKADPRANWVYCGRDLHATNPVMATALRNLSSFEAVHAALGVIKAAVPEAQFCVSGVILSKNIYQYGKFLVAVEVNDGTSGRALHRIYFLYQDASVQAIHNVGRKPYIALPAADVDALLRTALTESMVQVRDIHPADSLMNVVLQSDTYRRSEPPADAGSVSGVVVPGLQGDDGMLVTWVTQMPSNPYAGYALLKGLSVFRAPLNEGGRMRYAEFRPFSQILEKRLDDLQESLRAQLPPQGLSVGAAAQKILDDSKL